MSNVGSVEADEIVQLYVRDLVGNVTRPVKELKGFQRLRLKPGEKRTVSFVLKPAELAFYGQDMRLATEPLPIQRTASRFGLRLNFKGAF